MSQESFKLLSFLDFFELCVGITLEKDLYYDNNTKENILSIIKRSDLIYDKIEKTTTIISNGSLNYFTYKLFTVSAPDIKNCPEHDIISNTLLICRAEIIKKNYIIYEIPENLPIESSANLALYQISYERNPEIYANGRFLHFALTQGVIDNKKVYFRLISHNTEISEFFETSQDHQMICDYYNFEKYVREKHGDKKKITNSLVYAYATDWALQYQSGIPYTPALKGDENRKAIARMFINSPSYQAI